MFLFPPPPPSFQKYGIIRIKKYTVRSNTCMLYYELITCSMYMYIKVIKLLHTKKLILYINITYIYMYVLFLELFLD